MARIMREKERDRKERTYLRLGLHRERRGIGCGAGRCRIQDRQSVGFVELVDANGIYYISRPKKVKDGWVRTRRQEKGRTIAVS